MVIVSEKLQLFQSVVADESMAREEWHPFTKSFNYNHEIEIVINQQDIFMDKAELYIEATLNHETTAGKTGKCNLTNNAGAFLFVAYALNGREIEKVRDPDLTSTVKSLLTLNEYESKTLNAAGWNQHSGPYFVKTSDNDGTFNLLIPLHYLFGVFADQKNVIMGKQKIQLVRARNDENCYINEAGDKKATITISSIEPKVKHVYLNDMIKLNVFEGIAKNKPIFIAFRNWEIHSLRKGIFGL